MNTQTAVGGADDERGSDEPKRERKTVWEPEIPQLPADRAEARALVETLSWPDAPRRAHAGDWQASSFGPTIWRAPRGRYAYAEQKGYPDDCPPGAEDETFRTCSFCGSIHPQDLARFVLDAPDPATLPPLPPEPFEAMRIWEREHPDATMDEHMMAHDTAMQVYYRAKRERLRLGGADWKYGWPHKFYIEGIPNPAAGQLACVGGSSDSFYDEQGAYQYRVQPFIQPASTTMHAKWYNTHFADLRGETFTFMAALIYQCTGILFYRDPSDPEDPTRVHYRAPHRGYQA